MSLFAEYEPNAQGQVLEPGTLVIRGAEAQDLPRLAQLSQQRHGGPEQDHLRSWGMALQETQDENAAAVLVALLEHDVVAFGSARHIDVRDDPAYAAVPAGWYLTGVIVDPVHRRRGLGHALTQARMDRIAQRSERVYYFASAQNRPTIDLHERLGFVEVTRDFSFPGVTFTGGVGILFRAELTA